MCVTVSTFALTVMRTCELAVSFSCGGVVNGAAVDMKRKQTSPSRPVASLQGPAGPLASILTHVSTATFSTCGVVMEPQMPSQSSTSIWRRHKFVGCSHFVQLAATFGFLDSPKFT